MTSTLSNCSYAGDADCRDMIALLNRVRPPALLPDYPGVTDLRELLCLPSIQTNTRLWVDEAGGIKAFALVDAYNNLLFEVDPAVASSELHAQIVRWGMECVRNSAQTAGDNLTLDASCREEDDERMALLARHGYIRQPYQSLRLVRSLDDPIPEPVLPAGFQIRPLKGPAEVEAWVALHRSAFGTDAMTVEEKRAMMSGPDYDPHLDLVAVAPDGRLAAYCVCGLSREENARTGCQAGYTDPVATHPDFRKRGLARALLLTGLRLLKARGAQWAVMGTGSDNDPMQKTARAAGFSVQSVRLWFARPV